MVVGSQPQGKEFGGLLGMAERAREIEDKGDLESVLLAGDKGIFIASGNLTQICIWIIRIMRVC